MLISRLVTSSKDLASGMTRPLRHPTLVDGMAMVVDRAISGTLGKYVTPISPLTKPRAEQTLWMEEGYS
jgi:hypothetical protein